MKEASKLVMGASLVMLGSLAIILALVVVLLAELYCSLLLRRRRPLTTTTSSTNTNTEAGSFQPQLNLSGPLNTLYGQGVIQAPRRFLFPAIDGEEEQKEDKPKQQKEDKPKQQEQSKLQQELKPTQHCIRIIPTSSPPPSFVSKLSPKPILETPLEGGSSSDGSEHFVYISNPIFDGEAQRFSKVCTPFETPDSSPSRLDMSGSSSNNDEDDNHNIEIEEASSSSPSSLPMTPPLSPMKKLPSEACSVCLRDARSLGTSGSGSDTNNGNSSSSSGSPRTSPSW